MLHPAANRHPKGQINSLRRPRLPFASLYTIQKVPQSQINSFLSAFKLAVYHLSLSQRRPWQKTASHRPFDGLFALSSRHWPHSLCKRGKCKHTLSPSQRRPSQKTGSTDPSMVYSPCLHVTGHIPFVSGANVNIRFFRHNARLHRKLVPTDRSMVY